MSQTTVAKYLGPRPASPSPTWRTFLSTHVSQLASMDFFTVPTATFRVLFVLIILSHGRRRVIYRTYQRPLLALLFVVVLVLLVASANIANLQMARAVARRQESSVRRALGATEWRLARQLVESLTMATAGAAAGVAFASWSSRLLVAQVSSPVTSIRLDLPLDWRVLGFATALAVATAVMFGIAPAFQAAHVAPVAAMNAQGRSLTREDRAGFSAGLVVVQIGFSLVLVVFAQLFVRTFEHLANRPLGFETGRVLLARVDTAHAVAQPSDRSPYFHRLVAAVASVPGVARAAGSMTTPVDRSDFNAFVHVSGVLRERDPADQLEVQLCDAKLVYDVGTPLRTGRDFDARDAKGALPVVIVNESFVRRFFPAGSVIGQTISLTAGPREEYSFGTKTVVGIVGDAVYASVREAPQPTMYFRLPNGTCPFP